MREIAALTRRAERAEAELAKTKRVIEIQGNRLSAVGADARYREREREHRAMIERDSRRADADHRHPAGVPGGGRVCGDDLPSPPAARAQVRRPRPTPARALTQPEREAGARGAALRAVRRRLAGGDATRRCWTRAPTCARPARCTGSSRPSTAASESGATQLTHPAYAKPELLAERPNELWSWDVSKLKGPAKWTWFYLYVILDVFSRFVARRKTAVLFPDPLCGRRWRRPVMTGAHGPVAALSGT